MNWPPERKPLEGRIIRMEPLAEGHRGDLAALAAEPDIWLWMDRSIATDAGAFDRWFDERKRCSDRGEEWCFATRSQASGELVGSSSYLHVRPRHDGLEIGWTWLHPSAWRTGANREAKRLMLAFAFEELGCMRVEFKTDSRNERSRRALLDLGAQFEGIFRKHMYVPGAGVRDSAYYAIADDDWPAIKARLEEDTARSVTEEMNATA